MPNEYSHMKLSYEQHIGDYKTSIALGLNGPDTDTLDTVLAQMVQFLQMMGFTYVNALEAVTE